MKTLITPKMAKKMLEKNNINRDIIPARVAAYAEDMKKGDFIYTGEAICLAKDGTLLNGQHRLSAIVLSGVPAYIAISEDVDKDAINMIDTGAPRKASDVLKIHNIPNSQMVATLCRRILIKFEKKSKLSTIDKTTGALKVTNNEILKFYNKHSYSLHILLNYSRHLNQTGVTNILPSPDIAAYIYLFSYESNTEPINFMREIVQGVRLKDSNVAQLIRNKLLSAKLSKANRLTNKEKVELIIKGFRLYKNNEIRKSIKISPREKHNFTDDDVNNEPILNLEYMQQYHKSA